MLLSHNFTLPNTLLPALSREQFAQVFVAGLADLAGLNSRSVENPHWVVEVTFGPERSPTEVGQLCIQALAAARRPQLDSPASLPYILALGGTKTTPATSNAPDSLQPGDWGVDVVETLEPEGFLAGIQWESLSATKAPDEVFKLELRVAADG
ncbi:MAG: DUF2656 family protein [Synechococcales cyanobacterium RM1_1_8]|nr:DUF2656 family protein [Synechococcales cyanobacterium RM1_1_8]